MAQVPIWALFGWSVVADKLHGFAKQLRKLATDLKSVEIGVTGIYAEKLIEVAKDCDSDATVYMPNLIRDPWLISRKRGDTKRKTYVAMLFRRRLRARLLRLDIGRTNDFAPFLRFIGDELGEIGRRACKRGGTPLDEAGLYVGIVQARIDRLVQLVDDLGRRAFRRRYAAPEARLVARHEFGHRRDVRQRCLAGLRRDP